MRRVALNVIAYGSMREFNKVRVEVGEVGCISADLRIGDGERTETAKIAGGQVGTVSEPDSITFRRAPIHCRAFCQPCEGGEGENEKKGEGTHLHYARKLRRAREGACSGFEEC